MRILHCNKFYYVRWGTDAYFFALNRLLEEGGHKVIPFAMRSEKNYPSEFEPFFVNNTKLPPHRQWQAFNFFPWIKDGTKGVYSFEAKSNIKRLIARTKPDLAHIQNIHHHISPSILPAIKKWSIPIVMTLNDYKLICPNYSLFDGTKICERCKGHKYYQAILSRCFKGSSFYGLLVCLETYIHKLLKIYEDNVDIFIVANLFLRNKMIEFGINAKKIRVLPYFINAEDYQPSFENQGYFIYIGRIEKTKGVETLIRAVEESKIAKDYELWIIGEGSERKNLQQDCVKKGIKNIKFLGFQLPEKIKAIMKYSIMTIVPSRWYEVFGMVILESFAMGKPVIASRIGGIPEVVTEGEDGLLFNPEDSEDLKEKIEYCLRHQDEVKAMGKEARKKIERFYSPPQHLEGLFNIYRELGMKC